MFVSAGGWAAWPTQGARRAEQGQDGLAERNLDVGARRARSRRADAGPTPAANIRGLAQFIRREASGDTPVSLGAGEVLSARSGDANFATMDTSALSAGAAALAARALGSP
jgi:hypothetical protein